MNFTELFIRRPILATVVNLFLLIAGWQAIQALVVRQYPYTSSAVVTTCPFDRVAAAYGGGSLILGRGDAAKADAILDEASVMAKRTLRGGALCALRP